MREGLVRGCWAVLMAATVLGGMGWTGETPAEGTDSRAERKNLSTEARELARELRKMRMTVADDPEMEDSRKALQAAAKAYKELLESNPELKQAREQVEESKRALKAKADAKLSQDPRGSALLERLREVTRRLAEFRENHLARTRAKENALPRAEPSGKGTRKKERATAKDAAPQP